MSHTAYHRAIRVPVEALANPSHRFVLSVLADMANDAGFCWPSFGTLAELTGLSRQRVRVIVRDLTEAGFVTKAQRMRRDDGTQGSWVLAVLPVDNPADQRAPATTGDPHQRAWATTPARVGRRARTSMNPSGSRSTDDLDARDGQAVDNSAGLRSRFVSGVGWIHEVGR